MTMVGVACAGSCEDNERLRDMESTALSRARDDEAARKARDEATERLARDTAAKNAASDVWTAANKAMHDARQDERWADDKVKKQKEVLADLDRQLAAVRETMKADRGDASDGKANGTTSGRGEEARAREVALVARSKTELSKLEELESKAKDAREKRVFRENDSAKAQEAYNVAEERAANTYKEVKSRAQVAGTAGVTRAEDLNRFLDEYRRKSVNAQRCPTFRPSEINTALTMTRFDTAKTLLGKAMRDPQRELFAPQGARSQPGATATAGSSQDLLAGFGSGALPARILANLRARLREAEERFRNRLTAAQGTPR